MSDIEAVRQAVPLSPDETDDCCQRLCDRTPVETRTEASEWLVFLTALGCVHDSGDGYYRDDSELDTQSIREAFCNRLFGVDKVRHTLDSAPKPLSPEEILEELPESTRQRIERTTAQSEYITRLLNWGVTLGAIQKQQHTYTLS